jgi:hypothetical protein
MTRPTLYREKDMARAEETFRNPIRCMRVLAIAGAFVLVAGVASAGFQVPGNKTCTLNTSTNSIDCYVVFTNTSESGSETIDSIMETSPCLSMTIVGSPGRVQCGAGSGTASALLCYSDLTAPATGTVVTVLTSTPNDPASSCRVDTSFPVPASVCGTQATVDDLIAADFHLTGADVTSTHIFNDATGHVTATFPACEGIQGRITGGGSMFVGPLRVTHGFELHCDPEVGPNGLEVNWSGNHFHMEELLTAECTDDENIDQRPPSHAPFDTYVGTGVGRCNGVAGATISFTFTDYGEPGKLDTGELVITCLSGSGTAGVSVPADTRLKKGNHQTHRSTGIKQ